MADNIKIVGQITEIERITRYTLQEEQLFNPIVNQETFGQPSDYIEYFLFDSGGNVLNTDYNYNSYKLPPTSAYSQSLLPDIEIDPIKDIQSLGYESGELTSRYNFFRRISGFPFSNQLFIQQISTNRTELRVDSTELTGEELINIAENFANKQLEVPYYYYVILNFGDNNQIIAVNVISEVDQVGNVSILFKLYEPLPANIGLKSTFWIVEEIVNPYVFDVNLDKLITPLPQPFLKGPNFDIDLEIKEVTPTVYNNLNQLVTSFTGSSYQAVLNSLTNQNININVDFSVLNEFVHYSSATSRINNFLNKISEIEEYEYEINTLSPLTSSNASLINQVNKASSNLNTVIAGLDGFETYLYYSSSSLVSSITGYTLETGQYFKYNIAPYPKSNETKPYPLYASSSAIVQSWYNTTIDVANSFDVVNNKDILVNVIPSYILEDPDNYLPYILFVEMIGQYFDNIWIYIDKLTDLWDNNNNLNDGISQDLIYSWLQSFGMKLYNSQGNQNVLDYNIGSFSGSVEFNGDYSPSSSFLNNIPRKDLTIESYKRLYHNLPYLFKGKGAHGGLQGLISLFGITGSILPIKEYGGTNDYQDLKGYTTDKISIGSNNITGSILSPIKRLETTTTASREVKSQDLHFIDVSFSPQTQIDEAVSASIAASNPSWVIDDYVGYPQALYLDNYPSLSYQKDYWFSQTFTHPNEGFDYAGFIRLIQFFDNSLFKMIKDFTPARGNTWTGVSIKSPVLERPKVPEARPISNVQIDLNGDIDGVSIVPIYDPYYEYLEGNKEAYYQGNITGSFINTYAYFEENNINPYLVNNTIGFIPPGFVSGDTDFVLDYNANFYENFFYNSNFNALFNNVSKSLQSIYRKKLTPVLTTDTLGQAYTSYSIEEPIDLQDSYLSLKSHTNSRYNGVPLFGRSINAWNIGDISYGQNPVILHNTKKLGLFTEVVKSPLPYKSEIKLKYLVNESGSFTELNQRNRNWHEVQNTFKASNNLNVSLFNSQQYSNQTQTNGNKSIFESGYSYFPVFYSFGSQSLNQQTTSSVFNTLGTGNSNIISRFFSLNLSGSLLIPGGSNPINEYVSSSYLGTGAKYEVWNMFNLTGSNSNFGTFYSLGTGPGMDNDLTSSYYELSAEGSYEFTYKFKLNNNGDINAVLEGSMQIWHSGSNGVVPKYEQTLTSIIQQNYYDGNLTTIPNNYPDVSAILADPSFNKILLNGYSLYNYNNISQTPISIETINGDTLYRAYIYSYPSQGGININPGDFIPAPGDDPLSGGTIGGTTNTQIQLGRFLVKDGLDPVDPNTPKYINIEGPYDQSINQAMNFQGNYTVEIDQINFKVGDKIGFRFFLESSGDISQVTLLGRDGILEVTPSNNTLVVEPTDICVDQASNSFFLSTQLSPFFNNSYIFNPLDSLVSSSYADLSVEYGDILYPFVLEENDRIVIQIIDNNGPFVEYTVNNVIYSGDGIVYIIVKEDISGYFGNNCNKFFKIIFFKRVNDETNIIINLVKPNGKTSYGFVIPDNINRNLLDNIDIITTNTKQQLIDAGIDITQ